MIYHLNLNVGSMISGVEKAAILRHQVLKKKYCSQLLTMVYNPKLSKNLKEFDIKHDEYINMFDFYQNSLHLEKEKKVFIRDIFPKEKYNAVQLKNNQDFRLYYGNKYVAYLRVDEEKSIEYINYFDSSNRKIERYIYDSRGFLSLRRVLDHNNNPIVEYYYSPSGEIKLEKYFEKNGNKFYKFNGKEKNLLFGK